MVMDEAHTLVRFHSKADEKREKEEPSPALKEKQIDDLSKMFSALSVRGGGVAQDKDDKDVHTESFQGCKYRWTYQWLKEHATCRMFLFTATPKWGACSTCAGRRGSGTWWTCCPRKMIHRNGRW